MGIVSMIQNLMQFILRPHGTDPAFFQIIEHQQGRGADFIRAPIKGPLRLQTKPHDHLIGYELAGSLWVEVTKQGQGNKPLPQKKN